MLFLTRGRWRTAATAMTAGALAATTLAFAGAPAQAADPVSAQGGALSWGLSKYLTSTNMGRANPLGEEYEAPALFNADSRLARWGGGSGDLAADGSVSVEFRGASVNFAKTGGAWLRLIDPEVVLDADGNGTLTAEVAYGSASTGAPGNFTYDAEDLPARPVERVEVAELTGNSAAALQSTATSIKATGLEGAWSDEFIDFIDGDSEATPVVPGFIYAGQINNEVEDRTFEPLSFEVGAPVVEATAKVSGIDVNIAVSATNVNPDPDAQFYVNGVYVGFAEQQDIFVESEGQADGMEKYLASGHIDGSAIVDGALTTSFSVPKSKLVKGKTYAVYTWTAHGNPKPTDTQYTETLVTIPAAAFQKLSSKTAVKLKKKPTTKKKGKATITVKGVKAATPTGKVKVTLKKGKQTKKVNGKLNKKGKVTVKLPKLKKGKWKLVAKYTADSNYKKSKKVKKFKVKK